MKHEAIYNLHTNVKRIIEDTNGNITAYDANDNEVTITNWDAINTKATELETAEQTKITNKENNKASGKQKLIDLGLTEDEVNIIYGNN